METDKISGDILKAITQMGDALESFNDGFNKLNDINFDIETIFQVTGEAVRIEYDEEMINANEKYDTQAEITQNNFKSIRTKYLDVRFDSDIDQVIKKRIENLEALNISFDTIVNCYDKITTKEEVSSDSLVSGELASKSNEEFIKAHSKLTNMTAVIEKLKEIMVIP